MFKAHKFIKHTKLYKSFRALMFLIFIFLSSFQQLISQGKEYGIQIISDLCSEQFHGRGYDFASDLLVSEYIIKKLKKNKVKPFNKSYKQTFQINVNTFPGNNYVKIDGNVLEPAVDYISESFSGSVSGTFNIVKLDAGIIDDSIRFRQFLERDYTDKAILIDTAGLKRNDFSEGYNLITRRNVFNAKLIIRIEDSDLTFSPSQYAADYVLLSIKRGSVSDFPGEITVDIISKHLKDYTTQNVIGYLPGESDSVIVFSAHYDHIGHMGFKTFFPGANDNASGVAMLINLAKLLSKEKNRKHTIVFMFFSAEELGLLGSAFYVNNPIFPLEKIKFLINLDMVGSGDEGIKVVNGSVFKKEFNLLSKLNYKYNYLPSVNSRGAAANSDHFFFYREGVKSFFIYTLGQYKEYHNIDDKAENLPLHEFEDLSFLLMDFIQAN
jgi:aminopeptidase YwaD